MFADFTKFFDNVPHEELKGQFHEFTDFPEENALTDLLIDAFAPDVSYMDDEEYAAAMSVPYNSLEHMNYQGPGEKLLHKSIDGAFTGLTLPRSDSINSLHFDGW